VGVCVQNTRYGLQTRCVRVAMPLRRPRCRHSPERQPYTD